MLHLNHYLKEEDEKRSSTEEYWDATEIKRDGFNALLKFNFGEDANGNKYIITIDNNDAERFNAGSDEEAISVYEKWKEERKSGLVDYDFENSYDKITESDSQTTDFNDAVVDSYRHFSEELGWDENDITIDTILDDVLENYTLPDYLEVQNWTEKDYAQAARDVKWALEHKLGVKKDINESADIKSSSVEETKKYIEKKSQEYAKDSVKQRDIWSHIRGAFDLRRVSSKISEEDKQKYLNLLKELRDYSESINCIAGIRAVDQIIKTSFQGEKFEDKDKLKEKTYYALFSDGGNPYSALRGSSELQDSKNWYTTISNNQTREEFKKAVKSMAIRKAQNNYKDYTEDVDVKIFDDFNKFAEECRKVGITPNKLNESDEVTDEDEIFDPRDEVMYYLRKGDFRKANEKVKEYGLEDDLEEYMLDGLNDKQKRDYKEYLAKNESAKPKTLKEEILDDKTENNIISTIANIDELISTIEHTVEDDALTINSQIDAINAETTLNIERIYTTDLYSNLQSVKDDLEDAIKYSEMDKEEMNESVDDASFKKAVLDDFNEFIQNKYSISSVEDLVDQLEHVTEEDVNDYCSGKFYDIESEEDLDELNKSEEIIRKEYSVESEDDSYFEPTEEDIAEMKYWL